MLNEIFIPKTYKEFVDTIKKRKTEEINVILSKIINNIISFNKKLDEKKFINIFSILLSDFSKSASGEISSNNNDKENYLNIISKHIYNLFLIKEDICHSILQSEIDKINSFIFMNVDHSKQLSISNLLLLKLIIRIAVKTHSISNLCISCVLIISRIMNSLVIRNLRDLYYSLTLLCIIYEFVEKSIETPFIPEMINLIIKMIEIECQNDKFLKIFWEELNKLEVIDFNNKDTNKIPNIINKIPHINQNPSIYNKKIYYTQAYLSLIHLTQNIISLYNKKVYYPEIALKIQNKLQKLKNHYFKKNNYINEDLKNIIIKIGKSIDNSKEKRNKLMQDIKKIQSNNVLKLNPSYHDHKNAGYKKIKNKKIKLKKKNEIKNIKKDNEIMTIKIKKQREEQEKLIKEKRKEIRRFVREQGCVSNAK